jgi:hypothetical protein
MRHNRTHIPAKQYLKTAIGLFYLAIYSAMTAHAETATTSIKAPGANTLTQALSHWGVHHCSERVTQVSSFVGYNNASAAMALMPPAQVNQRMIPIAMEIPTESGAAYVTTSFAPGQANGCGAGYDAVVYWEKTCQNLADDQFSAYKPVGSLGKEIAVLDGGLATKVFLLPAGSGCVSIKKEIVL